MPSYYFPQLKKDASIAVLDAEEHHHLSRVKRAHIGQKILLNSGDGLIAEAEIEAIDKAQSRLKIIEIKSYAMPKPAFAIAFSLLKNQHDEMIVEKCTELGAKAFYPIICENTVRTVGKNTILRFEKVALAAIKQCDNPYLPKIHQPQKLSEAMGEIKRSYLPVIAYEKEEGMWLKDLQVVDDICFFVGPEGGYDAKELSLFQEYPKICLSQNILRAETAAIAAAAQFQNYLA